MSPAAHDAPDHFTHGIRMYACGLHVLTQCRCFQKDKPTTVLRIGCPDPSCPAPRGVESPIGRPACTAPEPPLVELIPEPLNLSQARLVKLADKAQEILKLCSFPGYEFLVLIAHGGVMLRGRYFEPDVYRPDDPPVEQLTRRWLLSPKMTKSEVVFTAYKCIATSYEHRSREGFLYRGRRVAGPHFDVDDLWELCGSRENAGARVEARAVLGEETERADFLERESSVKEEP